MKRETREVRLSSFDFTSQRASHIKLVKGVVLINPHLRVLCPTLAKGEVCRRGKRIKGGHPYRPELLVKNYHNPSLQLWSCPGCTNFLLRANLNEASLI